VIITIDGPAAAGKGTLARRLAGHLGFAYLDTGAIYRAVGLAVLESGGDPADPNVAAAAAQALDPAMRHRAELRTDPVAQAASKVAAVPAVRAALLQFQRDFAESPPEGKPGAILDGRDAGTVVCPDADVKFFITASPEERARRRLAELQARGDATKLETVLRDMQDRDARDAKRDVAPLKPAEDAVEIDTSGLNADAVFQAVLDVLAART
jgi:cytidylate kinase